MAESIWDDPELRKTLAGKKNEKKVLKYIRMFAKPAYPFIERHQDFLERVMKEQRTWEKVWDDPDILWKLMWQGELREYFTSSQVPVDDGTQLVYLTDPAKYVMGRWGLSEEADRLTGTATVQRIRGRHLDNQEANIRLLLRVEQEVAFWGNRYLNHPGLINVPASVLNRIMQTMNFLGHYPRSGGTRRKLLEEITLVKWKLPEEERERIFWLDEEGGREHPA